MDAVAPRSSTIFGPQLCLPRSQVTLVDERPFDLCQRIIFVLGIEIVDKLTTRFRDGCVVGGDAELPVCQAFHDRQSPALGQTRKDRE